MAVAARQVVLDGAVVRAWAEGALVACRAARERIDAVNVFPVPDADTGSNVLLTVAGGVDALAAAVPGAGPAQVAATFAQGAARAARGNSGIILSQWLVGLAASLSEVDGAGVEAPGSGAAAAAGVRAEVGVEALVRALESAARAAHGSVPDPQEGTVLTVAREVAAHARRRAAEDAAAVDVLAGAADAARADLARLSAGHDVLRAARVVDAGACALLVVLDALVAALRGDAADASGVDLAWLPRATPEVVAGCAPAAGGAFEVMMLVRSSWSGVDGLTHALQELGDAVAVGDAGPSRHAHVHCDDPAAVVALVPSSALEQAVVRRIDGPAPTGRGLVVLTASPGLAAWYATCGAVVLVGTRPDAEQVARAGTDGGSARPVVVDAGVGIEGGQDAGDVLDVVTAPGDGAAVVACLALVADAAPQAARDAVRRVRGTTPPAPDAVVPAAGDLLQQVPGAQGVTVVHGDVDVDVVRAVEAALAAAHPQLEVVVAGPATGPAWWVGVD